MTLGELIEFLEKQDTALLLPEGFANPHSYRGYYDELAFEPAQNVTVGSMLDAAKSALGTTYEGWKGGEYTMQAYTDCWLASRGDTGEGLGAGMLRLMIAAGEREHQAAAEPAKVIIVECEGKPARLFAATGWEVLGTGPEAGDLALAADGDERVAQIGARHWDTVCKAESVLPADLYARHGKKLAIALDALREMREHGDEAASEALAQIADVDL